MTTTRLMVLISIFAFVSDATFVFANPATTIREHLANERGLCAVVDPSDTSVPFELVQQTELTVYVQSASPEICRDVRTKAAKEGLLGSRIFVVSGDSNRIQLASNLADAVIVGDSANGDVMRSEVLRVLRPEGKALIGDKLITKPQPKGLDEWNHPYHGPDNNPQSRDQVARGPFLTHFLAEPWFGPMPEVTVTSGGRIFKAFGHVAYKPREWPLLNTLVCLNAYNGTELWRRKLREGYMVHRNTMIATPKILMLGDDQACKLIDAASGKQLDAIELKGDDSQPLAWKWMAMKDGVLFALLGKQEQKTIAKKGVRALAGWPWREMGKGYAQADYPWGFGKTLVAIDPSSKKILWQYEETEPLDSRASCMTSGRLFFYSHGNFLGCLDAKSGSIAWKTSDADVLDAIGEHGRAQNPQLGFSSTSYAKCNDQAIYFAGPQRKNLVAVSAKTGRLLWQHPHGNFQLVLRDDALYALGRTETSKKFDLTSGKMLADLQCYRGNCTRATATVDSIFTRGHRHTGTQQLSFDGDRLTRISMMRPACQDGVVVSNGLLYWGPWMCDCNLSLVGVLSLAPAGDFDFDSAATDAGRLEKFRDAPTKVVALDVTANDWPTYRQNNARQSGVYVSVGKPSGINCEFAPKGVDSLTAPVIVGNLAISAASNGSVQAIDLDSKDTRWTTYTGGKIFYPPTIWNGRAFVGSADGYVYCLEAATGETIWRFRAAPENRMIPVYGKLSSTWPVASGVLVEDGIAYAAAGIANYDGTHVFALDAVTGKIVWQNNTSGRMFGDDLVTGVSVQGHLLKHEDRIYLAGGNVVSPAIYDAKTGECVNDLSKSSGQWTKAPRGRELFLMGKEVVAFDRLLYSPKPYQVGRYHSQNRFLQASYGNVLVRARPGRIVRIQDANADTKKIAGVWENAVFEQVDALAVAADQIVVTGTLRGQTPEVLGKHIVAGLNLETGKLLWHETLPGAPASWGLAIGASGTVCVTTQDGQLICYK